MRHRALNPVFAFVFCLFLLPAKSHADEKRFVLHADPALVEAGLMRHLLPRFSMKTNTRITLSDSPDGADAALTTTPAPGSAPVIASGDTTWSFDVNGARPEAEAHVARFGDWLQSDIGKRTIEAYKLDGEAAFAPPQPRAEETTALALGRDVTEGISLSLIHCGRCHVIGPQNRRNGIGSTPSFAVLRTLGDWQNRFESFYALNPHPAFTQVAEVTPPFDPERPSPIHPLSITLEDLDEIIAYVTRMSPADLGAPIRHQ